MATIPIGGDAAPVTLPGMLPAMPAVARVLGQFDRSKLGAAIEVMIALLDLTEPDTDAEPSGWPEDVRAIDREHLPDDSEAVGDEADTAWIEWERLPGSVKRAGGHGGAHDEDDEDDDPDRGHDEGEPDFAPSRERDGAGCSIADPGGCEHDGREPDSDMEREQMAGDVPMLPVVSAEHNIFTDRRVPLGISNLQSSYRTNGGEVRSADSGAVFRSTWSADQKPGIPV